MDTAHVRYNCFRRFEPGPDTLGKYLLGGTSVVWSDLLHQWMNKMIFFSYEHQHVDISICALEFHLVHDILDTCAIPLHPAISLTFGVPYLAIHACFSKS
jgi:hypothetical protein